MDLFLDRGGVCIIVLLRLETSMSSRLTFSLDLSSCRLVTSCDGLSSDPLRSNEPSGAETTTWSSEVMREDCKSIMNPAERRSSFICSRLRRLRSRDSSWSMASIWHALSLVPPTVNVTEQWSKINNKSIMSKNSREMIHNSTDLCTRQSSNKTNLSPTAYHFLTEYTRTLVPT